MNKINCIKRLQIIFLFFAVIFLSCTKDKKVVPENKIEVSNPSGTDNSIYLGIDGVKKAYFNDQGRRYYSNYINNPGESYRFKVYLNSNILYRFYVVNAPYKTNLYLLKYNGDTLKSAEQFEDKAVITHVSAVADTFFVVVKSISGYDNFNPFKFVFEETGTYLLNWNGYSWEADGNWVVNDSNQLQFNGQGTLGQRWVRLQLNTLYKYNVDIDVKDISGTGNIYRGLCFRAQNDPLQYGSYFNTPTTGEYFRMNSYNSYELWKGTGGGWSFDYGVVSPGINYGINQWNKIRVEVIENNYNVKINNNLLINNNPLNIPAGTIYIMVGDNKSDTVVFKNFLLDIVP